MNYRSKKTWTLIATFTFILSQAQLTLLPAMAHAEVELSNVKVTASASSGTLTVTWSEPVNSQRLNITAPGWQVTDELDAGQTEVTGIFPGESLLITVDVRSAPSVQASAEIKTQTALSDSVVLAEFESINIQTIQLEMPSAGFSTSSAQAVALPSATSFRYTTFIPQEQVFDPMINLCPATFGSYFLGDNRGFDASSSSFRTRVNVRVDWAAGGAVSYTRSVGLSTVYSYVQVNDYVSYYTRSTAYADLSEVTVKPRYISTTHVVFTMDHNAVDPVCPAAVEANSGIKYHYDVTVQRSGNYGLEGWALRAPAHEAYIRDSDSPAWKTVFQRENTGFYCLLGNDLPEFKTNQSYSGAVL